MLDRSSYIQAVLGEDAPVPVIANPAQDPQQGPQLAQQPGQQQGGQK
jgi:multicomponent Na+:H+ antiporter subunit D